MQNSGSIFEEESPSWNGVLRDRQANGRALLNASALNAADTIAATGFGLIKRFIRGAKQDFAFLVVGPE